MTYRITLQFADGRTVVHNWAGCADEADARQKAQEWFAEAKIKKVETVKEGR